MDFGLSNIAFLIALGTAVYFFTKQVRSIRRNVLLGRDINRTDQPAERWKTMARVALGQSKMVTRPVAGFFHILIYVGFVLINLEVLEIFLDGLLGTHRILSAPLGAVYHAAINFFEILGVLVVVACIVFLYRRNIQKLARFHKPEMNGWPTKDGNLILIIELVLMSALLLMNAADANLSNGHGPYVVSGLIAPLFAGMSETSLHLFERTMWWMHLIGILAFLNYLPISKHFHIILSFPNVWYSNLKAKGRFSNMESVTKEVKMMLDPSADPYAAPAEPEADAPQRFGAKDVFDLHWVNLLNAYTCTECGRCTSECPANQTGKKLSPRKIMMDTRDRLEQVGKVLDQNQGTWVDDGKSLLDDHITREELWACTSCNACVEACPVGIDPLSIILDMRRYLVMEESAAPQELNLMMTNVENNGAPWQFAQADRLNWKDA